MKTDELLKLVTSRPWTTGQVMSLSGMWHCFLYESDGKGVIARVDSENSEADCAARAVLAKRAVNSFEPMWDALKSVAKQCLESEMPEDEREDADYRGAYDHIVREVRATLEFIERGDA